MSIIVALAILTTLALIALAFYTRHARRVHEVEKDFGGRRWTSAELATIASQAHTDNLVYHSEPSKA